MAQAPLQRSVTKVIFRNPDRIWFWQRQAGLLWGWPGECDHHHHHHRTDCKSNQTLDNTSGLFIFYASHQKIMMIIIMIIMITMTMACRHIPTMVGMCQWQNPTYMKNIIGSIYVSKYSITTDGFGMYIFSNWSPSGQICSESIALCSSTPLLHSILHLADPLGELITSINITLILATIIYSY